MRAEMKYFFLRLPVFCRLSAINTHAQRRTSFVVAICDYYQLHAEGGSSYSSRRREQTCCIPPRQTKQHGRGRRCSGQGADAATGEHRSGRLHGRGARRARGADRERERAGGARPSLHPPSLTPSPNNNFPEQELLKNVQRDKGQPVEGDVRTEEVLPEPG